MSAPVFPGMRAAFQTGGAKYGFLWRALQGFPAVWARQAAPVGSALFEGGHTGPFPLPQAHPRSCRAPVGYNAQSIPSVGVPAGQTAGIVLPPGSPRRAPARSAALKYKPITPKRTRWSRPRRWFRRSCCAGPGRGEPGYGPGFPSVWDAGFRRIPAQCWKGRGFPQWCPVPHR